MLYRGASSQGRTACRGIWASDYPHLDASFGVVKELRERIASLPLASQKKVLGENVLRFYGLG